MKKLFYLIICVFCTPFYSNATKIIVLGHVNSVTQLQTFDGCTAPNGCTLTTIYKQEGGPGEICYTIEDDQPSINVITTSDPTLYLNQLNTSVNWTLHVNDVNFTSFTGDPNRRKPPIVDIPGLTQVALGNL